MTAPDPVGSGGTMPQPGPDPHPRTRRPLTAGQAPARTAPRPDPGPHRADDTAGPDVQPAPGPHTGR